MMRNNHRSQVITLLVLVGLTITTGVAFAAFWGLAEAEESAPTLTPTPTSTSTAAQVCPSRNITNAPYPASRFICGVGFQKSSHRREAPGSDNWPVTWADDNNQYTAWGDGGGFGGTNSDGRVSLGVARVSGDHNSYSGKNVWGGKNPENPAQFNGKSYAIISIDGVLYMMVTPGSGTTGFNFIEVAQSTNHSQTWQKANFRWNKSEGLIKPAFLQFGRDYADARDDFVYVYMIGLEDDSGLVVQKPGRVYLLRVPKTEVFGSKSNYQYFNGLNSSGDPIWSNNISNKRPVFEDPRGVGWNLAVSFNAGLNRYLLTTEHDSSFRGNLGIFDAPTPWGPWTTVSYHFNWQGFREESRGPFYWNFSNKWLRNEGRDFTLVFTGGPGGGIDSWNSINGTFATNGEPDDGTNGEPDDGVVERACTLDDQAGRIIVEFPEDVVLTTRKQSENSFGPLTVDIPSGTYHITLVSFDDHIQKPQEEDQTQESWFLQAEDEEGDIFFESNAISDLPEAQNILEEHIEEHVEITQDITGLSAKHVLDVGESDTAESIWPVCAAFDRVEENNNP